MSCHSCGIVPPFLLVSIRDHVAANPEFYAELATDLTEFAYDRKAYFTYWNTSVPAKFKLPADSEYPNEEHQKTLDRASGAAAIGSKSSPNDTSDGKGDGKKEQSDDEQERSIGASAQSAAAAAASAGPPNADDSSSADAARGVSAGGGSTGSHTSSAAKSESLLSRLQKPSGWYTDKDRSSQRGMEFRNTLKSAASVPGSALAVVGGAFGGALFGGMAGGAAPTVKLIAAAAHSDTAPGAKLAGAIFLTPFIASGGFIAGTIGGLGYGAIKAGKKTVESGASAAKKTADLMQFYFAEEDLSSYFSGESYSQKIFLSDASSKTDHYADISDEFSFPRTLTGIQARSKSSLAERTYQAIEQTLAFLAQRFDRNSIDGKGQMIIASLGYPREDGDRKLSNAYWSPSKQQILIGKGDGLILNELGWDLTTIVHETIHGMTQHTLKLKYQGQSGALDEHISDVFAILVKNNTLWDSPSEDIKADPVWYIGEDLVQPEYKRELSKRFPGQFFHALRSMKNPGSAYNLGSEFRERTRLPARDPQVSKMDDYVRTRADHGGIHTNSGIPNKAFYLFATHVGHEALRTAGKVWYATITSGKLRNNATFIDFAEETMETIRHVSPSDRSVLRKAWSDVGITV